MSSVLTGAESRIDWFEEICQQLDALRLDCQACCNDDETLPTNRQFEEAKLFIEKMRSLAEYPNLPKAHVWTGPDGHIGFTWRTPGMNLDVILANSIIAIATIDKKRQRVELSNLSTVMKALTA